MSSAPPRTSAASPLARHAVRVAGTGPATLVFIHGYGCGQAMWRFVAPVLARRHRVVLMDLAGHGAALQAYDMVRHASLEGHAEDVLAVVHAVLRDAPQPGPVVLVGHSVGCMIALLAHLREPGLFAGHVMVAPSPSYLDDGDYPGGFTRPALDAVLEALEDNQVAWAQTMARVVMGEGHPDALREELGASFINVDPQVARQFARTTFLTDLRAKLPLLDAPTLLLQCSSDKLAPLGVGDYLQRHLPDAELQVIANSGHCPHLSAPEPTLERIGAFLERLL